MTNRGQKSPLEAPGAANVPHETHGLLEVPDHCHLAMEGERDPERLHDQALMGLVPATIWRELS